MIVKYVEENEIFFKIRAISNLIKAKFILLLFLIMFIPLHAANKWIDTYQSLGLAYKH